MLFKTLFNFLGHSDVVKSLCVCGDRNLLASGSVDSKIKIWDLTGQLEPKQTLAIHSGMVRCMCYIETKGILISGSTDNLIKATRIDKF